MSNGAQRILLLAAVLAVMACLPPFPGAGRALAEGLPRGDGETGPPARIMFPAGNGSDFDKTGMNPAVFNHRLHEGKIGDCDTCHHTGDRTACGDCHTVKGSDEGGFVTLQQAMHGRAAQSCVGCHEKQLRRPECAGCHSLFQARRDDAWCAGCHFGSPETRQSAAEGSLSAEANAALAKTLITDRKHARHTAPEQMPRTVEIGALAGEYEPARFRHARHMRLLMDRIKGDALARAFHRRQETLCTACHHNAPPSAAPPRCVSCHKIGKDGISPPPLMAAYHLQCMGCHENMGVRHPRKTDCAVCHRNRADRQGE